MHTLSRPPFVPQIRRYQDWLQTQRGLAFDSYDALWRWSVHDLDAYWQSVWDFYEMQSPTPHDAVLADRRMPGARWFPGAQVNYAQQVLRHADAAHAAGLPAIVSHDERSLGQRAPREISWPQLRLQVASLALHLQEQGVRPGDRVVAYLPNIPEAMVAFLATVSIGGVWSICAPDMGSNAVLDRFRQIAPTVLIGGAPAATAGTPCTCVGPPDTIALGSATVLIGGKPAARMGDTTAHGGSIVMGCPTVLIGG